MPLLETRVKLDIPAIDAVQGGEGYKTLTRDTIVDLCREALQDVPEYASLMEVQVKHGAELALAWRRQTRLDWIWLEDDVNGSHRDWEILYGLVMRQVSSIPRFQNLQIHICVGIGPYSCTIGTPRCC